MRAIDADVLKTKKVRSKERCEWVVPVAEIDWMPTIEPQRKKGEWKMALTKDLIGFNTVCFRCSVCNGMEYSTSPFCRMCGAEMEGQDGV